MPIKVKQLREALELVDRYGGAETVREMLESVDKAMSKDPYALKTGVVVFRTDEPWVTWPKKSK